MKNRVALVTGGARGIGLGIAEAFLQRGARVMIADLGERASTAHGAWSYDLSSSRDLDAAVARLDQSGEARATTVDVTDPASCERAVDDVLDAFGQLDVLVNNAGIVGSGAVDDFDVAEWDRIFAVNAKGIFLMTRAALPALRRSTNAAIINIASIAGKKGYPNMSAYCGSKFAAIGITQSLAAELAKDGIRVNALCPGMVGTAMWLEHLMPMNLLDQAAKTSQFAAAMADTIPMGRPQTPEDMGEAAAYLAEAPNVTGISLSVSGGFEMN